MLSLNLDSLTAQRHLNANRRAESTALERLASGKRINRGSDDPAGLISAQQLESAIRSLEAESQVISRQDANANIADGAMSQLASMTGELQALLVKGGNSGALSPEEQAAYQAEADALVSSIQKFSESAAGSLASTGVPDADALADALRSGASSLSALASGGGASLGSGNLEAAQEAVSTAMTAFSDVRGKLGGYQKYSLEARASAGAVTRENLLAARSQIVDADYAEEVSNLSRAQMLSEAGVKVLGIINRRNEAVLNLLG